MSKTGRGDQQYMMRFPDGMRDQVAAIAEANGRSMNTQIVIALEKMLAENGVAPTPPPKPYNARLDMFVAAALSGLVARNMEVDYSEALAIGQSMLEAMESE